MSRRFHLYKDIKIYARVSHLVYYENDHIVSNSKSLFEGDMQYVDAGYFPYRQTARKGITGSLNYTGKVINKVIKHFRDDINCLVFESKSRKETIIAFRGTNPTDPLDLKNDLNLATGNFFPLSEEIKEYVKKIIHKSTAKEHQIIFTGHSLGGYIASKMTIEFKHTSVIFDSPGVEAALGHHEGADIHCFVSSPNFVNCLGIHLGKIYYIPWLTGSVDYAKPILEMITAGLQSGATYIPDIKAAVINNFVKPLACSAISHFSGISKDKVQFFLESAIEVTSAFADKSVTAVKEKFEEKNKKHGLVEKFKHTMETHNMIVMLNNVHNHREQKIKQINSKSWPNAQFFYEVELKICTNIKYIVPEKALERTPSLRSRFEWLKNKINQVEVIKPGLVDVLSQEPVRPKIEKQNLGTVLELGDTFKEKENKSTEILFPEESVSPKIAELSLESSSTTKNSFIEARTRPYVLLLSILVLLYAISNDPKQVLVGFLIGALGLEVIIKSGVKFENSFLAGLFSQQNRGCPSNSTSQNSQSFSF